MKRYLLLLTLTLFSTEVLAVVVAGGNGGSDNTNNTTKSQLEQVVSDGFFLNNVFRYNGGNAVYIGYKNTGSGKVGYALSGMHLGTDTTLTIQGTTYDLDARTSMDGSDLALFEFSHSLDVMPNLQALNLSSSTPTVGSDVVMIGEGRNRVETAATSPNDDDSTTVAKGSGTGYTTSSTRLLRWGTNQTGSFSGSPTTTVSGTGLSPTSAIGTGFSQPGPGEWLTTTEGQAVQNDSGGGLFLYDGTLAGIMIAVSGANTSETQIAAFDDMTFSADIASYKSDIDFETGGVLIPELPPWVMMSGCVGIYFLGTGLFKRNPRMN